MEYKLNVEVSLARPLNANLSDNEKMEGLIQYLILQGMVEPGSVVWDPAGGKARVKVTEAALQFAEKYVK